jgi:hypothetical protein
LFDFLTFFDGYFYHKRRMSTPIAFGREHFDQLAAARDLEDLPN